MPLLLAEDVMSKRLSSSVSIKKVVAGEDGVPREGKLSKLDKLNIQAYISQTCCSGGVH